MKVIDCDCGKTLQAGNDEDLAAAVQGHVAEDHSGEELNEAQARQLVAERAYEATDS